MTPEDGRKLLELKNAAVAHFEGEHWLELGAITGFLERVQNHNRLLRSLSFSDPDYGTHAFYMLTQMVEATPENLQIIEDYISRKFPAGGLNVSSTEKVGKRIYFTPSVFEVPATETEPDLLSIMMPFSADFAPVHAAVVEAARRNGMRAQRANDIWIHSAVIQDIFSLIYRSHIVVCDFTGKNANVFYEAGIAHTLGKHVVPITQYAGDIPFDLQAHRYLHYLNNSEGHARLQDEIAQRISTLLHPAFHHRRTWF